jgi:hypothetical protein
VLFSHADYLTLVDTTGRIQRQDKHSFLPVTLPSILQRLSIGADEWIENTQNFEMVSYKKFITNEILSSVSPTLTSATVNLLSMSSVA